MVEMEGSKGKAVSIPCACNADPFADLPPEARPRGRAPMGNLRRVICPQCGLEYWTNRTGDVCPDCEKSAT